MKKTITLSLLLAASTMCAYADSLLEEIYASSKAITLSPTEERPDSWTDTDSADALVSTTVDGAKAGDILAQIDFSFNITGPTNDKSKFNILSIVSTGGGTAYQVASELVSYSPDRGGSGKLYIGQSDTSGDTWVGGFSFSYGLDCTASLTLTAGAEAGHVTIALSLNGGTPVSFESENTNLLTGDFSKLVIGGSKAEGSLTVTSVKARKAKSENDDAVPEPTTATLSLLALAGLAARRRRK